jgi:formamidopyrimidine-DNA glycosylase
LSEAQAVSGPIKWSVVIDSAVRSFVRGNDWLVALQLSCLSGPGESSTGRLTLTIGYDRSTVPELPDLTVVAEAFHAALAGRAITGASALAPLAVRGTPAELDALVGQRVASIRRRGKFLVIDLDGDAIVVNPMLTGRFQLAAPGAKHPTKTAVVWAFGSRARVPTDAARWTAGASWRPSDDAVAEVRYRDPTQMGKVYLQPVGVDRPVPGLGAPDQGPDADDPTLTLDVWRERIKRHPGELKNLLRNQAFVAGIGNAYSDEILHAARLLPFRKRASLAGEEVDALYAATRSTLTDAVEVLRARVPPTFETQVRDFLAVHDKGGQPCPRCGTRITEVRAGGFITSYCRGCQR